MTPPAPSLALASPAALPARRGPRHALRTLWLGLWLGLQVEANWTDPFLFAIYAIVRPLGGLLILVFMYRVVAGGQRGPELDYFVVGSAFWPLVLNGVQGMAWGVLDDRERFRTLRYVYTSPISIPMYLAGRGAAQASIALAATVITLLFGRFVLGVPISLATTDWGYLALSLVLGLAAVLGLALVSVTFVLGVSREAWRLPEAIGAALYLVCGAIFPLTVLPSWLAALSAFIPLTWWLEAVRRALLGPEALSSFPTLSDAQVLAALALSSLLGLVVGVLSFRWGMDRARRLGVLDRDSAS
jgi:ABC-2 type transport system permease protein